MCLPLSSGYFPQPWYQIPFIQTLDYEGDSQGKKNLCKPTAFLDCSITRLCVTVIVQAVV